jgi:CheY-like chemotaxis protein
MCAYGTGLAFISFMSAESNVPVTGIARKNLSVCVLDDDPDHVEITSHRLEKAGFIASGTTDPEEALQQVRMGTCRVVLADLKMQKVVRMAFL